MFQKAVICAMEGKDAQRCLAKCEDDSEGTKWRGCCTECMNDPKRHGTISERFLKESIMRERDA
jgi:hypothetical protein